MLDSVLADSGISLGSLTLTAALRTLLILVFGVIAVKLILHFTAKLVRRSKTPETLTGYLLSGEKALLYIVLLLAVLSSLGVEITSLVALLSVAGLAVSLALQSTLANVAGGMMLLISKPFSVGDYVSINGTEGIVHALQLSVTSLTTLDNKQIFIPNSQITAATIVNFNRLGRRRVDLTFTASYDAPTADVKAALRDAIAQFPQILSSPAHEIYVSEYGASSISYLLRVWVKANDYWPVYFGLLETVRETFAAHKVEMTYDHLNVHVVQD